MKRILITAGLILTVLVTAGVLGSAKEPLQPSVFCIIPETEDDGITEKDVHDAVEVDDSCSPLVPGPKGLIE